MCMTTHSMPLANEQETLLKSAMCMWLHQANKCDYMIIYIVLLGMLFAECSTDWMGQSHAVLV